MKKIITIITTLLTSNAFAINEAQFVKALTDNHPFFKEQNASLQVYELNKKIANPYKQWSVVSSVKHSNTQNILTNSIEKTNISGDKITISNTLADNFNISSTSSTPYSSSLGVDYSIPLLKNKGGINNSLGYDTAIIDQQINILQNNIDAQSFINNALKKFYKMKFLQQKLHIEVEKTAIAKQQLQLLQNKFKDNLVDKADVLLQKNNYQSATINTLNTKQQLTTITQELQSLIHLQIDTNDVSLENITTISTNNNFDIQNLATIKILDLNYQKQQRQLQSLINQDNTQVDLNFGVKKTHTGNSLLGKEISDENTASIGLTIALPLSDGNSVSKNLILQKQQQIKILKSQKQQKMIDIKNNHFAILAQLNNLKEVIKINKNQLKTSEQKVFEFEKMYKNNNTELSFLINARSNQKTFELNYLNNVLTYKNLQLDYKLLTL